MEHVQLLICNCPGLEGQAGRAYLLAMATTRKGLADKRFHMSSKLTARSLTKKIVVRPATATELRRSLRLSKHEIAIARDLVGSVRSRRTKAS